MWHPTIIRTIANLLSFKLNKVNKKRISLKMMKISHLRIGWFAERKAARYLQARGITIIERNFRLRSGEIDIIGKDGNTIIFVEVKFRSSEEFGKAEEAVSSYQQNRIKNTATLFLNNFKLGTPKRFDIIAITKGNKFKKYEIKWLKDAY